jgi:predicted RNA-binding protein YlxR (DUF448 family)
MDRRAQARVPQRTCVSCRETAAKRGLVRLVRTPEGTVEIDETGKKAGRGAYLCPRLECWQEALKKERLAKALRTRLWETDTKALEAYADRFLKPESAQKAPDKASR